MKNYNLNVKTDIKKRSYLFSLDIINFIETFDKNQTNSIFIHQLLRSATSIGANIIEAQAASSKKDFINFYHHSLKSANETKYWLCLLRDSKRTDYNKTQKLLDEATELSNMLGSSILTMKGRK
jgi:four helix bundle protein